ncbi:MAG: hypothetical protein AB7D28_09705, partial [Candidatus Berkiella sp.]
TTTNNLVDLDVAANVGTGLVTGILHTVDNIAANIEVNAAILADAYSDSCDSEDDSNPYSIGNLLGLSVVSDISTNILTDVLHSVDDVAANIEINADILSNSTSEACYPDSEDYPNNNPTTTNNLVDLDVAANVGTGLVTGILHAVDNIAANVEIKADILNNSTSEACYPDSEDYPNNNPTTTNSLVDLDVAANVDTGFVTGILHAVDNIAANVDIKADILSSNTEACYPDSEDYPNTNHPTTNSLVDLDVVANVGTSLVTGILQTVDNIAANVDVNANILSNNASEESPSECNETSNTGSLITLLGGFGDDIITTANKNLETILKNGTQDIADFIKDASEVKIPESISVSDLGINASITTALDNMNTDHCPDVAAITVTAAVSLLENSVEPTHIAASTAPLFESVGLTQAHDAITETLNSIHSGLDSLFGR